MITGRASPNQGEFSKCKGGILTYALLGALATGLLIAAFTDLRRREIDNWLTAAIALAAPLFWLASEFSLGAMGIQFAIALGSFVILTGLFALNMMGGGDVKLLTALSLWIAHATLALTGSEEPLVPACPSSSCSPARPG